VREEPRAQVLATKHDHGGERLRIWLGMVSLGQDDPWVGFVPSPRACRGGGKHGEGGSSARLIANDCLKYLFI
jgi:hypothetical protein